MTYSSKTRMNGQVQRKTIVIKGVMIMWTEKQVDELIAQEIEKNPELAAVFEAEPEKKEQYKQKIFDSQMGGGGALPGKDCLCSSCVFAETIDPIGKQPQTRYCMVYGRKDSRGKPDEVLYNGAKCEFYEKEKQK